MDGAATTDAAASVVTHAYTRPLSYFLGLLVGLAAYNGVHVDLPLPPSIYKTIKGEEVQYSAHSK